MKTNKKMLSVLIAVALLLTALPIAFGVSATGFAGGTGTAENPYQVATAEQLDAIRNDLDAHYIQVADIDLSDWGNWEPIGKAISEYIGNEPKYEEELFTGTFDGNYFIIKNLTISDSDSSTPYYDCYGLFAGAKNATFNNITLDNISINIDKTTTDYAELYEESSTQYGINAGGIVGNANNTNIVNCSVGGNITVKNILIAYVGGIAGSCNTIKKCINNAGIHIETNKKYRDPDAINNRVYAGGIVAYSRMNDGLVEECTNKGNIYVLSDYPTLGGICGNGLKIKNCVNFGNLTSDHGVYYIGGIAGSVSKIENAVNYGNIEGNSLIKIARRPSAGGIVADTSASSSLKSCYNKAEYITATDTHNYFESCLIGQCSIGTLENCFSSYSNISECTLTHKNFNMLSDEAFLDEATYIGFDFENTWVIDKNIGGAVLKIAPAPHEHGFIPVTLSEPTCTEKGKQIYSCSCDEAYIVETPALGHSYDDDGYCTRCGDYNSEYDTAKDDINPEDDCSCRCHKTGFAGLLWKIIKIFYKMFKINPVCACGIAHY